MEKIFELCKERGIRCHFSYWKFDDSIHEDICRTRLQAYAGRFDQGY